jgi:hypothetical protein
VEVRLGIRKPIQSIESLCYKTCIIIPSIFARISFFSYYHCFSSNFHIFMGVTKAKCCKYFCQEVTWETQLAENSVGGPLGPGPDDIRNILG